MHSIQWHTLKIQIKQYLEYHKLEFGLQHYLKFTSLRLPLPKRHTNSTYANDITIAASHTNHHLSPTTHSTMFLQIIILFTPDPAEYGTTLLFNINNQTPPTTKHPKTLGITFDSKLTFSQHINLTVIKAKQTFNICKARTSNN